VLSLDMKAGDGVLFGKYTGTEIKLDGEEHLILREEDNPRRLSPGTFLSAAFTEVLRPILAEKGIDPEDPRAVNRGSRKNMRRGPTSGAPAASRRSGP
jgi:hypothetical protein